MAQISFKLFLNWISDLVGILIIYTAFDFQKMVLVPDFDYYKSRMYFFFGFVYLSLMIINYYRNIEKKNIEIRILKKKEKAIEETRKFYENKNRNSGGNINDYSGGGDTPSEL